MAPIFKREGDYLVEECIYTFKEICFVQTERSSSRLLQTSGMSDYIYSCCTANDVLKKAGAVDTECLVPTCSACDLFVQDRAVRKLLMNKTQFCPGVGKKYKCNWLLRRQEVSAEQLESQDTIPASTTNIKNTTTTDQPITNSTQILQKKKKRKRASTKTDKDNTSKADDKLSKILELKKKLSSDLSDEKNKNIKLRKKCDSIREENQKLSAEVEKLKDMLDTNHAKSLPVAMDKFILDRYKWKQKTEDFIVENVSDAILDRSFLGGKCNNYLQKKTLVDDPPPTRNCSLRDLIEKDYLAGLFKSGIHAKTKASHIFNELWTKEFLNGALDKITKKNYVEEFKAQCPYNQPEAVLRVMDLSGGKVNQSCINELRNVENLGKYERSEYLVSTNKLKILQEQIHENMKVSCPYKVIDNRDGIDGIEFDYSVLLTFLLKMFKLDKIARQEGKVSIAITLDGANLSRNIQHVTCGVKILDPRAVNPLTGIPIGLEGVQSRDFCFPFNILLAKDTKALYQTHFQTFNPYYQ